MCRRASATPDQLLFLRYECTCIAVCRPFWSLQTLERADCLDGRCVFRCTAVLHCKLRPLHVPAISRSSLHLTWLGATAGSKYTTAAAACMPAVAHSTCQQTPRSAHMLAFVVIKRFVWLCFSLHTVCEDDLQLPHASHVCPDRGRGMQGQPTLGC
jgi:hypothetical protein